MGTVDDLMHLLYNYVHLYENFQLVDFCYPFALVKDQTIIKFDSFKPPACKPIWSSALICERRKAGRAG